MARHADLTSNQMRQGIERLRKRLVEVRAFEPGIITRQFHNPEIDRLRASVEDGLIRTFGADTFEYRRYSEAASFSTGSIFINREAHPHEVQQALNQAKATSIALLEQAISSLEEQIAELGDTGGSTIAADDALKVKPLSRKVFVVHGHDEGARETVARYLERLGFEAIILHEQANQGRTVVEKIEAYGDVGFAVVLLTPDDYGGKEGEKPKPRARQNVVLELGYFVGRLGRGRVCALLRGDLEIPSDFTGVVYQAMDEAGGWKGALAKELSVAGHDIDWSKVVG